MLASIGSGRDLSVCKSGATNQFAFPLTRPLRNEEQLEARKWHEKDGQSNYEEFIQEVELDGPEHIAEYYYYQKDSYLLSLHGIRKRRGRRAGPAPEKIRITVTGPTVVVAGPPGVAGTAAVVTRSKAVVTGPPEVGTAVVVTESKAVATGPPAAGPPGVTETAVMVTGLKAVVKGPKEVVEGPQGVTGTAAVVTGLKAVVTGPKAVVAGPPG